MKNNKKGVSAVVATVLIVMITVAAVGLLWVIIVPFLETNIGGTECMGAEISLTIDKSSDYTCTNDTITKVRVERSSDSANIVAVQVKYVKGGDSNTIDHDTVEVNNAKVFTTNLYNMSTAVAVAPIISVDGENITCKMSPEVSNLRTCA